MNFKIFTEYKFVHAEIKMWGKIMKKNGLLFILITMFLVFSLPVNSQSQSDTLAALKTSDRVHIFYYPWYGNPEIDGHYYHWNHRKEGRRHMGEHYPGGDDIGSSFYPSLGCYSSNDPEIIKAHMQQIKEAGAGVIVLSWWGPNGFEDKAVPLLMDIADEYGLKVSFIIEPYDNTIENIKRSIVYILKNYSSHNAFFREKRKENLPVFYVFTAGDIESQEWKKLLSVDGELSIRDTRIDALVLGQWYDPKDYYGEVISGGFDGFFTYTPVEGLFFMNSIGNWKSMQNFAAKHDLIFSPSVGPGFSDIRIRDWNGGSFRDRQNGAFYDRLFKAAIEADPFYITITSFNEWPEGTQIEPAVPKSIPGFTYKDYSPLDPEYYIRRTRYWVDKYMKETGE